MRALLTLLLGLIATQAAGQVRAVDMAKSRLAFVYTLEKKIAVEGRFPKFDARVVFDEKQPEKGSVKLEVDIVAIDTGTSDGDAEVKQGVWFDTSRFPKATFLSHSIKRRGERHYEALGTLSIKGTPREVAIPFTVAKAAGGGLDAKGSFTIRRLLFSVGVGQWADPNQVADEVEVKFNLLLGAPR